MKYKKFLLAISLVLLSSCGEKPLNYEYRNKTLFLPSVNSVPYYLSQVEMPKFQVNVLNWNDVDLWLSYGYTEDEVKENKNTILVEPGTRLMKNGVLLEFEWESYVCEMSLYFGWSNISKTQETVFYRFVCNY